MSSRERMLRVLSGERVTPPPVVLHSWGDYKIEFSGHHRKFQYYQGGRELAEIERTFHERFRPDWMHFGSAGWKGFWDRARKVEDGKVYLASADGSRWIEIRDDYGLSDYSDVSWWGNGPTLRLESKAEIDDFYAAIAHSEQQIIESGRFEHMKMLSLECGSEVSGRSFRFPTTSTKAEAPQTPLPHSTFLAINDGAPGSWLHGWSFEDTAIACADKPDLVAHCIYKDCERFLTDVRAAKACGADAYIFSEGFPGSLDNISPAMHERLEGDTKRWFYSEVRKIGLLPIGYWLGDVRPNMGLINSLDMAGLMIEESKKTFTLDPVAIRRLLRPEVCLFGNVDSTLLRRGTPDEVRAQVRQQLKAAEYGPFVLANGSPIVPATPVENLDAYMDEGRS